MTNNRSRAYGPMWPSKLDLMGIRFVDAGGDGSGAGGDDGGKPKPQEQTFTQAQVDAIVQQRLEQQAKNKYGDYDDLKAQAAGAKTLEQQLADLTTKFSESETKALRASIAAEFGISTKKGPKGEPSDADLLLTGSDEATMRAQAERLGASAAERKKQGNVAPKEGGTVNAGDGNEAMREFTRNLFASAE